MAISRADLLKEMLPALNALFEDVYKGYAEQIIHLVMRKRGSYEVWQGNKRMAKGIRHRKEALALIKLLKGNENG